MSMSMRRNLIHPQTPSRRTGRGRRLWKTGRGKGKNADGRTAQTELRHVDNLLKISRQNVENFACRPAARAQVRQEPTLARMIAAESSVTLSSVSPLRPESHSWIRPMQPLMMKALYIS